MNNKKEFSKKIFNIIITLFIAVIVYSMALMWKTDSTDALAYLIPSVGGLTATCVGFYYWKAKTENMIKLQRENNVSIEELEEMEEEFNEDEELVEYEYEIESEE